MAVVYLLTFLMAFGLMGASSSTAPALAADDQCTTTGTSNQAECAFNALQHQAQKKSLSGIASSQSDFCSANASVTCPGSSNSCAGGQCCPGYPATGGKTFPCPSASNSFSDCQV